ncbi:MAG: hypothetical protein FWH05_01760 [Oscillospiraceae bacterium]|nr:hypothetical protein [Oscillospiraceae bacterium]
MLKLEEGNLRFCFSPRYTNAERFDDKEKNADGMKAADFVAETIENLYFIEVKDFQNPCATDENRRSDCEKLGVATKMKEKNEKKGDRKSIFVLEMGETIKDSLLRKYALGEKISKAVIYLLFVNFDALGAEERGRLKAKISGHVPTGLKDERFTEFTNITFDLVNATQLKERHDISCTVINVPKQPHTPKNS